MEPRIAITRRRQHSLTPLIADHWDLKLQNTCLHTKYPQIVKYISQGTHTSIPQLHHLYTPFNKQSTETLCKVFNSMIQVEFDNTGGKGPNNQWEHAEYIENPVNK